MENPFTLTFGKEPLLTIRRENLYSQIINDFSLKNSSSQIYVITGARGVGKTVLLTEQYEYFNKQNNWLVVDVNPHRNIQEDLASSIYEKGKLQRLFLKKEFDFSFHGISFHLEGSQPVSSVSMILDRMFQYLRKKGIKVLITLDEVVTNNNVKEFAHDFQSYLRKNYMVYLLMTGLYENVSSLQNDKSLTFLYRAPKLLLKPLDLFSIKNSYIKNLNIDPKTASELAKLTNGYGFGYQLVGYLYFKYKTINQDFLNEYDEQLKINAYDKIYSSISENERAIVKCFLKDNEVKTSYIMKLTKLPNNKYSVYRERLLNKGVVVSQRNGYLSLALPRFKDFLINNYL